MRHDLRLIDGLGKKLGNLESPSRLTSEARDGSVWMCLRLSKETFTDMRKVEV